MTLYMAVTCDKYELPLFVTDSAVAMADWAGIKVKSVHEAASKNKGKPPLPGKNKRGRNQYGHRIRKITVEEDE